MQYDMNAVSKSVFFTLSLNWSDITVGVIVTCSNDYVI